MNRLPPRWLVALVLAAGIDAASAQEIGLQLYSLRHQIAADLPGSLKQAGDWGIKVVEGGGDLGGFSIADFRAELHKNDLALVNVSTSYEELRDNPIAVAYKAGWFGARLATFYWIPHDGDIGFTFDDARAAVRIMNEAGKLLKANGITLQYHPHGYEFGPHGEGTLLDWMIENVSEAEFQMDVFWVKQGGADPVALLQKYPGRFKSLHLKDRLPGTPDSSDGHADDESNVVLGTGDVDIAGVIAEARRQGIRYWFIEDESSRVLQQVPASIDYLESLD